MMIIGREIADSILSILSKQNTDTMPVLGIIVGTRDPVIESFVRIKLRTAERLGVIIKRIDIDEVGTTQDYIEAIEILEKTVTGIVVQLPLPKHIDTDKVLRAISKEKDVDALNPDLNDDERLVQAPVAEAVLEILKYQKVEVDGKNVVVAGSGRLVGAPSARLLQAAGAHVVVANRDSDTTTAFQDADIIVLGAGSPHFLKPNMIKGGVIVIDAGTSESGGVVIGDADPTCAGKASLITPVPGGVGPVAVAMLFRNLFIISNNLLRHYTTVFHKY